MSSISDQLQTLCGKMGVPVPPPPPMVATAPQPVVHLPQKPPKPYQPFSGIDCYCPCDFRDLPIEPGTVQAVLTDIPYDEDWLEYVPEFGTWCAENFLTTESWSRSTVTPSCGYVALDDRGQAFVYRWQLVSPIYGVARSYGRFVARYQLAVVFSKSQDWHPRQAVADIMPAGQRVKGKHPHRKTVAQMQFLTEQFSDEGCLVVDPCAGGWTTAEASPP